MITYSNMQVTHMNTIQLKILDKLHFHGCWHKGHMLTQTITDGIPRDKHGEVKDELKTLVKQGYLIKYPTQNGTAYYLNPLRTREIKDILGLL